MQGCCTLFTHWGPNICIGAGRRRRALQCPRKATDPVHEALYCAAWLQRNALTDFAAAWTVPARRGCREDAPHAAPRLLPGLRACLSDAQVRPPALLACALRAQAPGRPLKTHCILRCGRVVGGNAIGNGYWYSMGADGEGEVTWAAPCSAADAATIQAEMQALVSCVTPPSECGTESGTVGAPSRGTRPKMRLSTDTRTTESGTRLRRCLAVTRARRAEQVEQDVAIVDELVPYAAALDYFTSARQLVAAKLICNRVPLSGVCESECRQAHIGTRAPRPTPLPQPCTRIAAHVAALILRYARAWALSRTLFHSHTLFHSLAPGNVGVKTCSIGGKRHLRLNLFPLLPSTGALSCKFRVLPYHAGGLMLVLGHALADQVQSPPLSLFMCLCGRVRCA